jgi:hypothetical protein
MRVKSINCTDFLREKTVHFNEQCDSGAMLHCSVVLPYEKQQNAASTKPAAQLQN